MRIAGLDESGLDHEDDGRAGLFVDGGHGVGVEVDVEAVGALGARVAAVPPGALLGEVAIERDGERDQLAQGVWRSSPGDRRLSRWLSRSSILATSESVWGAQSFWAARAARKPAL